MSRTSLSTILLMFLFIAWTIIISGVVIFGYGTNGTVGLLQMDAMQAYLILWVIWPIVGSIIAIFLFPRILTPLFMLVKRAIRRDYEDGYVDVESKSLNSSTLIHRGAYTFLLTCGLLSALATVFDPSDFIPVDIYPTLENATFNLIYIVALTGLLTPIVAGFWAIGWSLEDSGLINFKIPSTTDELYEIEPVYRTFSSYLKGFAGLSSVLFLIVISFYYQALGPESYIDALTVFFIPIHTVFMIIPAYLIYTRLNLDWLTKNKKQMRRITKEQIQLYE